MRKRPTTAQLEHAAVLGSRVLQLANGLAVSLVVVWDYGLASAGTLALASLSGALAALAIGAGLPSALPRAGGSVAAAANLGAVITTTLVVPVGLAVAFYAVLLGHDRNEAVTIAALGLAGGLAGQVNVQQTLYVMQSRAGRAPLIVAPLVPALHLAGTGLAATAHSFEAFALVLLATRVAGCAAGFVPFAYARVAPGALRAILRDALRFMPLDLAGLLGEQLPVVVLAGYLSRPELGAFGLLRQFVTVADTPGWSFVFTHYPALVEDTPAAGPRVARSNERLAWVAGAGCVIVTVALALFAYRIPSVALALPVVLLPMPARYLNNFVEQALRATGFVGDCACLALAKIALSLMFFGFLAALEGFWGAVGASALLSLASGQHYRHRMLMRFPGIFRPLRPWRLA